jgi:hypothetical protein
VVGADLVLVEKVDGIEEDKVGVTLPLTDEGVIVLRDVPDKLTADDGTVEPPFWEELSIMLDEGVIGDTETSEDETREEPTCDELGASVVLDVVIGLPEVSDEKLVSEELADSPELDGVVESREVANEEASDVVDNVVRITLDPLSEDADEVVSGLVGVEEIESAPEVLEKKEVNESEVEVSVGRVKIFEVVVAHTQLRVLDDNTSSLEEENTGTLLDGASVTLDELDETVPSLVVVSGLVGVDDSEVIGRVGEVGVGEDSVIEKLSVEDSNDE